MSDKKPSDLVAATMALDEELAKVEHLADAAGRVPLSSRRNLEKAARTTAEAAEAQGKVGEHIAALMAALDGVVSVCSWVVHLAGALGRPTLALAPYAPEWRYGHSGDRMLWYPSVRVMRQPAFGDWDSLLASLRSALAAGRWSQ